MTRRGRRATEAALRVAASLGLAVLQAVSLTDRNNALAAAVKRVHAALSDFDGRLTSRMLLDCETACAGPLEWDLAALRNDAVARWPNADSHLGSDAQRMRHRQV